MTVEAAAGGVLGTSRITVAGPELAALLDLQDATGGAEWGAALGWSLRVPVVEWRGVETDSAGAVTGLSLSGVGLAGELPPTLGNLVRLETIDLSDNNLTGSIPGELGMPPGLRAIDLSGNGLTGEIPAPLFVRPLVDGNTSPAANADGAVGGAGDTVPVSRAGRRGYVFDYDVLDLSHNQLTGTIPAVLDSVGVFLWSLEALDLSHNRLTGEIPRWMGNNSGLPSLEVLDLSHNQLVGTISPQLGYSTRVGGLRLHLSNQVSIDLSHNQLTGPIPEQLGNLLYLGVLDLSHNQVEGPIPPWLSNPSLPFLRVLDPSENRLTGPIPRELGFDYLSPEDAGTHVPANLASLNLSGNELGPDPRGVRQPAVAGSARPCRQPTDG